jgi:hypothetical protein
VNLAANKLPNSHDHEKSFRSGRALLPGPRPSPPEVPTATTRRRSHPHWLIRGEARRGITGEAAALNAARDQVILAAGVLAGPVTDLAATIGRHVLGSLMPISPRAVKRAMSRYNARGKVDRATRKATIASPSSATP